jgi:Holliday junction resolvase RusA-like endonuclease
MSEELELYGTAKKSTNFFIHCNPPKSTAQASHRIMKRRDGTQFVGKFDTSNGKKTQDELLILLQQHMSDHTRFEGPVKLSVHWHYAWRKSEPKKNKRHGWKWCDTRPDVDNLCKLLFDCMTRIGFWTDDSQIAILYFEKQWCDVPGIGIKIEEL